ncbi:endonuclease III [Patescibacteria group bacterium]|nr:endonuclease III [Patescibacteria group bacterium]MBU1448409.1 endonuclease III [Patescibacteria group bacterium]MBU2613501.1 endonuclease III [Patescibacteria group bacterium]
MKPSTDSVVKTLAVLKKAYPQKPDMDLGTPDDTILGTLLSARTTDAQVLKIWPSFRKRFPTWPSLAEANVEDIASAINTVGLYRSKAKAISGLAKKILADFGGNVPRTMEELTTLPGVGRKTASCVLSYAFGVPSIAVDTHVFRIARRLGWSSSRTPEQVERDLLALVSKRLWGEVNRRFVHFGRDVCIGGTPRCWRCPVACWCTFTPKTARPASR